MATCARCLRDDVPADQLVVAGDAAEWLCPRCADEVE